MLVRTAFPPADSSMALGVKGLRGFCEMGFPKIRGALFGGPCNKDPTIAPPSFGNPQIAQELD